ncbi:porphobilinogen deaminase [Achromatium sp. WMS2]|nr:porphobilinogen deaminase [Achromatium sp. WMS2]
MAGLTLRIATRKSPLALWQTEYVATRLRKLQPGLEVQIIGMSTQGDKMLEAPLAEVGGKGLFVKELEQGILDGKVDIAVHSMKDVPIELPGSLHIPVILAREDPYDAFVSNKYSTLSEIPKGGVVGTSSLRRECQLRALRPDLKITALRGNIGTRLLRLDEDKYDAIILACAGLKRLGASERIREILSPEQILPAIGQGAIGIECKVKDMFTNAMIAPLADTETTHCVKAERAINQHLQGGCHMPIAGYAAKADNKLYLRGLVGTPNGSHVLRVEGTAAFSQAEALGAKLARELLELGAKDILNIRN